MLKLATRQTRDNSDVTGLRSHAAGTQMDLNVLIARIARERDLDAFEKIYRYFAPRIRSYMSKVTKDRAEAEEITQETMAAIWRKAAQFDPERGQASTWIFTIARNLRIDALRKGPRPDFDAEDPSLKPHEIEEADSLYHRMQVAGAVQAAMKELRAEQIQVLKMSYFEEMPHSAIAAALKIPIGTVKSRIRMACEKLRVSLEDKL